MSTAKIDKIHSSSVPSSTMRDGLRDRSAATLLERRLYTLTRLDETRKPPPPLCPSRCCVCVSVTTCLHHFHAPLQFRWFRACYGSLLKFSERRPCARARYSRGWRLFLRTDWDARCIGDVSAGCRGSFVFRDTLRYEKWLVVGDLYGKIGTLKKDRGPEIC